MDPDEMAKHWQGFLEHKRKEQIRIIKETTAALDIAQWPIGMVKYFREQWMQETENTEEERAAAISMYDAELLRRAEQGETDWRAKPSEESQ